MIEVCGIKKSFKVTKKTKGIQNFIKREYQTVNALNDINFKINDGEMVGYIGPNGAGKSSTIKVLCGVLTPDQGTCVVDGRIPWINRVEHVNNIGVVFGQRSQLWWDIPVIDSFELLKDIYKVSDKLYKDNLHMITDIFRLEDIVKIPTRQLSLGQRMKCEIAASLLHNPNILFLDEPTIGLDAISKREVRQFISMLNKEKKTTVILTTHDMQDIDALTERIILIGKGEILYDGYKNEIKEKHRKVIKIDYSGNEPELLPGMKLLQKSNGQIEIEVANGVIGYSECIAYLASKVDILNLSVSDTPIEDIVIEMYREYGI